MGIGVDLGGIHGPVHVAGLMLLGKHHGHAQLQPYGGGDGDAGGLDGQNFGNAAIPERLGHGLGDLLQERRVDLLVEKAADFQDLAGQNLALGTNFFFHESH